MRANELSCRAGICFFLLAGQGTMIENLLELIGGRQTIQAATERFYEKVLEDDSLRHFFTSTDMAHLRSRQVMFISMLLGGGVYTGKDVHEAHALARNDGLSDGQFDLFLKHSRAANRFARCMLGVLVSAGAAI